MPQVKEQSEAVASLTDEDRQLAEATVKALNEKRTEEAKAGPAPTDYSTPRAKKGGEIRGAIIVSDIPTPVELDPENFGPTAFAAIPVGEITGSQDSQMFVLDPDKVQFLNFQQPGQNLPKKRLYTIKAFKPEGGLVQLPFEPQIQNNAGGDPEDAIGLRRYARKGYLLLMDPNTLQPVYCAAWGCWAQADGKTGFCTPRHASHTLPNQYKDAGEIVSGLMSRGVTTSRTWSS